MTNYMKVKLSTIMLLVATVSGCATTQYGSSTKDMSDLKTQIAIEYIKNGDVNAAKLVLDDAIQKNPNNALAYMMLGVTYQLDATPASLKEAEKFFKKAIALDPTNAQIRNNYGQYLYIIKSYTASINEFNIAANSIGYSNRDSAFSNLGYTYYRLNNMELAKASFLSALKMNPQLPDALLGLSEVYYNTGKTKESVELYTSYANLVPLQNRDSKGLWLGIRLAHMNNQEEDKLNMINILATKYPSSEEYASYAKQSNRKDIAWSY